MKSIERVRQALAAHGLAMQVRALPQSTRTAQLAADAIGCPLGAIVKSLLFLADDRPVLLLVAGDRRVDTQRLRLLLGAARVTMADADRVRAETGATIGGVPPLGHPVPLPTYVDRSLSRFATVWAAAGGPNAVFPIDYPVLLSITAGQLADVVLDEAAEAPL